MKTIALNATAAKALDRIAEPHRTHIAEALAAYALGKPSDTKAMQGGAARTATGTGQVVDMLRHSVAQRTGGAA